MQTKEKDENKRTSKMTIETYINQNAHDLYGNIYTLKSQWYRVKGSQQKCLRNIIITINNLSVKIGINSIKKIDDKELRRTVKNSVAYGKGQLIGVEAI